MDELFNDLIYLAEVQFEKFEFDNEVALPYNYKTETENDSVIKQ